MKRVVVLGLFFLILLSVFSLAIEETTVYSYGFENGMDAWKDYWVTPNNAGTCKIISGDAYSGDKSLSISTIGAGDIVLQYDKEIPLQKNTLYELSAWVKTSNTSVNLAYHKIENNGGFDWGVNWKLVSKAETWTCIKNFILCDETMKSIQPIFIINKSGTVLIDDIQIKQVGFVTKNAEMPKNLSASNDLLDLNFNSSTQVFSVFDKRNKRTWEQKEYNAGLVLLDASSDGTQILTTYYSGANNQTFQAVTRLDSDAPEISVEISSTGEMKEQLMFPQPFVSGIGSSLVIPSFSGKLIPVDDKTKNPEILPCYAGAGLDMSFFGVSTEDSSMMTIINTPDDADVLIERYDGLFFGMTRWQGQKGMFAYNRKLTYVFFDKPGIVPIAFRYRKEALKLGYVKTLTEKRRENENVDFIIGTPSVTINFTDEAQQLPVYNDMQAAGMSKIIMETSSIQDSLKNYDPRKVMFTQYEALVEVTNPQYRQRYPDLNNIPSSVWPDGLLKDSEGNLVSGWTRYADTGGVLQTTSKTCPSQYLSYGKTNYAIRQKAYPYVATFSDALINSQFAECYNTRHPSTRTQSKVSTLDYFKFISTDKKMLLGTEVGKDEFVPYMHFSDGLMSSSIFDFRNDKTVYNDVPTDYVEYGINQSRKIPLWELVYHDCVVSYSSSVNANNKHPQYWLKMDLFNVLYGTPPKYKVNPDDIRKYSSEFSRSYKMTTEVSRAVGYAQMTDFQYLTTDKNVQMTRFSNGVQVIVNFGNVSYRNDDGVIIKALGYQVYGLKNAQSSQNPVKSATVSPSSSRMIVNDRMIQMPSYNISGYNYIKIRDLAENMKNTESGFDVVWNGTSRAIEIQAHKEYTSVGGELASVAALPVTATLSDSPILYDGVQVKLTGYNIGGYNYFKLRDVAALLDFGISYDAGSGSVVIKTDSKYSAQ